MKKFLLLTTIAVIACLTANAATDYGITVAGTKVTSDNLSFSLGGGTVRYNVRTNNLYLQDVNLTVASNVINVQANSNRTDNHLYINFNGSNTLISTAASAVIIADKTSIAVNSGTTRICAIPTNGMTGYNAIAVQNCALVLRGKGKLQLASLLGPTIAGAAANTSTTLTFSIKECEVGGYDGTVIGSYPRITRFYNVKVNETTYEIDSYDYYVTTGKVTLYKTNNAFQVTDVIGWTNSTNMKFQTPEYTYFDSSTYGLSNPYCTLSYFDIVISDLKDNPKYTAVGNFLYNTGGYGNGYYAGTTVARLMAPTLAYLKSEPATIEVPGFVTLDGTQYPVLVAQLAFEGMEYTTNIRYRFGVVGIEYQAMSNCPYLSQVVLPSTVKRLGSNLFKNSGDPEGNLIVHWATLDPSDAEVESAFEGCNAKVRNVNFPTSAAYVTARTVSTIESSPVIVRYDSEWACDTYYLNYADRYVVTKGFLTSDPGEMTLVGCPSTLNNLVVNRTVVFGGKTYHSTSVAATAFLDHPGLTNVDLSDTSIKTIGTDAFRYASELKTLTLGSGITSFGGYTFEGCGELTNIYAKMMDPASISYGGAEFAGVSQENCTLHIPAGTLAEYKAIQPWKRFFHIVEEGGFAQGDVNGDGVVSGADVTAIYNVLLGGATADGDADVNGDGIISGADVTALYNILLN